MKVVPVLWDSFKHHQGACLTLKMQLVERNLVSLHLSFLAKPLLVRPSPPDSQQAEASRGLHLPSFELQFPAQGCFKFPLEGSACSDTNRACPPTRYGLASEIHVGTLHTWAALAS